MTPTIAYGGTTIDLGLPGPSGNSRELDQRVLARRTLDGNLRPTVLSHSYRYRLTFGWIDRAVYDSLVTLWRSAVEAGAYPTFTFTDAWPSANGVLVGLDIGALEREFGDRGSFSLMLTEVAPR